MSLNVNDGMSLYSGSLMLLNLIVNKIYFIQLLLIPVGFVQLKHCHSNEIFHLYWTGTPLGRRNCVAM